MTLCSIIIHLLCLKSYTILRNISPDITIVIELIITAVSSLYINMCKPNMSKYTDFSLDSNDAVGSSEEDVSSFTTARRLSPTC